jgi:hypothetical protein
MSMKMKMRRKSAVLLHAPALPVRVTKNVDRPPDRGLHNPVLVPVPVPLHRPGRAAILKVSRASK